MTKPGHSARYITSGSQAEFVDKKQTVLKNKLGIKRLKQLHLREEEGLVDCYQQMVRTIHVDTPLSIQLIREIHLGIFGDIYEWAGQWRNVSISKGTTMWAHPAFIDGLMQQFEVEVLQQTKATLSDVAFCQAVALIQGEFLTIHPFREGNARTIKVLTDLFAAQTDRPFLSYDESHAGQVAYINAAIAAFDRDYQPLEAITLAALTKSRAELSGNADLRDAETLG